MIIDYKTYKISPDNYYKATNAKTQIVIGFSLRKNHNHIIRLQNKEYGKTKKWNNYTISRDGEIYQHFDSKKHSDFIGIKEVDIRVISIVLENLGYLVKNSDGFMNLLNESCDEENVVLKKFDAFSYWEKIYDEQMTALAELCIELCSEFAIPCECLEFQNYHKSVSKFRGIAFKSNYYEQNTDINPTFDVEKFNKLLVSMNNN